MVPTVGMGKSHRSVVYLHVPPVDAYAASIPAAVAIDASIANESHVPPKAAQLASQLSSTAASKITVGGGGGDGGAGGGSGVVPAQGQMPGRPPLQVQPKFELSAVFELNVQWPFVWIVGMSPRSLRSRKEMQ